MKNNLISLTIIVTSLALLVARAEEGGSGHYAPGEMASFFDTLPPKPGLAVANYFMYYDATAAGRTLEFGGLTTFNSHAQAFSDSLMVMYETDLELLGGHYVPAVGIPYVWLEVDGNVTGPLGPVRMRDTANGLGDILVYPLLFGWVKGDLKYDLRFGIYAPTGDYDKGRLANVGKNYWTFEPTASVSWFSSKIGLESTAFACLDFSTKNDDTDYQSGDVFHLDATLAEHLPVGKLGVVGVGATAFYYQQITGDSGSGAVLGEFEGRTVGVGPVVSFITKIGQNDLVAEVKWLPELDVEKRLKGDYVWFKLGMAF